MTISNFCTTFLFVNYCSNIFRP